MKSKDQSKEVLIDKIKALEEEVEQLKDRDSKRIHTEKALIKSKERLRYQDEYEDLIFFLKLVI